MPKNQLNKDLIQASQTEDEDSDDFSDDKWQDYIDAQYKTKAKRKLLNYIEEIIERDCFQKDISELRKKLKIPSQGLPDKETLSTRPKELSDKELKFAEKSIQSLCKKYHINFFAWWAELMIYFYYNSLDSGSDILAQNLILISDLAEESREPFSEDIIKEEIIHFPIALKISPYASENDILDYVKKTYTNTILPQLKKYQNPKISIGKTRTKNPRIKERNSFIYSNKNLPHKEIKKLVKDSFGEDLDYEYIGKIISDIRKKRKKV